MSPDRLCGSEDHSDVPFRCCALEAAQEANSNYSAPDGYAKAAGILCISVSLLPCSYSCFLYPLDWGGDKTGEDGDELEEGEASTEGSTEGEGERGRSCNLSIQ